MFDSFGIMTTEELNELANNLKNEGDKDSIEALAKENGLDPDIAKAFISGEIPVFADVLSAAIGKIDIEAKELKPKEIVVDWINYIKARCLEDNNMAKAVRDKNKTLKGALAALLTWSFQNAYDVDRDIVKEANVKAGRVKMGIPGSGTAKKLINEYYLGGAE